MLSCSTLALSHVRKLPDSGFAQILTELQGSNRLLMQWTSWQAGAYAPALVVDQRGPHQVVQNMPQTCTNLLQSIGVCCNRAHELFSHG